MVGSFIARPEEVEAKRGVLSVGSKKINAVSSFAHYLELNAKDLSMPVDSVAKELAKGHLLDRALL